MTLSCEHSGTVPHCARGSTDGRFPRALILFLTLCLLLFLSRLCLGQSARSRTPDCRIQLRVDAHCGNDSLATGAAVNNPNGVNPICVGTPGRSHDVVDPTQDGSVLLHASWPFRTLMPVLAYYLSLPLADTSSTPPFWIWQHVISELLLGSHHAAMTDDPHNEVRVNNPGRPTADLRGRPVATRPVAMRNTASHTRSQSTAESRRRAVILRRDTPCNEPSRRGRPGVPVLDLSPHDLGFSPAGAGAGVERNSNSWMSSIPPDTGKGSLNPLVNSGFFWNFKAASQARDDLPLPGVTQSSWTPARWEGACEGFGNPRAINRQNPNPPQGCLKNGQTHPNGAYADIGTDECSALPVVGYRFGTTMLIDIDAPPVPGNLATIALDNKYIWYFGRGRTMLACHARRYRGCNHLPNPLFNHRSLHPWWRDNGRSVVTGAIADIRAHADTQPKLAPDTQPWWHLILPRSHSGSRRFTAFE